MNRAILSLYFRTPTWFVRYLQIHQGAVACTVCNRESPSEQILDPLSKVIALASSGSRIWRAVPRGMWECGTQPSLLGAS